MSQRPTAVIIDDATFIRQSFAALMPDLRTLQAFATIEQFMSSNLRPELVVLELQRADKFPVEMRAGLEGLRTASALGIPIAIYTPEERPFVHAACLASGAAGVVSKAVPMPTAEQSFLQIARGRAIVTPDLIAAFDLLPRPHLLTFLTARQTAILAARARRHAFADIAEHLDLATAVVMDEWRATSMALRNYLRSASLEAATGQLGLVADELADIWPAGDSSTTAAAHEEPASSTATTRRRMIHG